jgi:hypothetical protein
MFKNCIGSFKRSNCALNLIYMRDASGVPRESNEIKQLLYVLYTSNIVQRFERAGVR